ncbi:MAG: hypothetical protein FWG70_12010 [Oscillospiraceae bacterium]|nr:hypothetical protein [Oscillospiraceae bacterium]
MSRVFFAGGVNLRDEFNGTPWAASPTKRGLTFGGGCGRMGVVGSEGRY